MLVKTKLKYISVICFIFLIINVINFKLPDIVISKNTKLVAVKDLEDRKLYLIKGFREKYSKKIWQKELDIKKVNKKYLNKICNINYCYIPDQKLLILLNEEYGEKKVELCNRLDIKVVVNLTNLHFKCNNEVLNLNKFNFIKNGTYLVYKIRGNYNVITEKDHILNKPWVKFF